MPRKTKIAARALVSPLTAAPPQEPPTTAAPPREPPPAWFLKVALRARFAYPQMATIDQLVRAPEKPWFLPPFQRQAVWTPEQQVAFCCSVWQGRPIAPILIATYGFLATERVYVIDGQQRLTALDVHLVRTDGSANPRSHAYFDLDTGTWSTNRGLLGVTMRHAASANTSAYDELGLAYATEDYATMQKLAYASMRVGSVQLVIYTLDNPSAADLVAAYRSINHPGVPINPADLDALVALADGWTPTAQETP